ncbi:MAG: hypothetical protein ACYCOR_06405, partial [Acidobacteriaceae bacterium]
SESPSAFKKTECAVPGNPARECDALARFRAVPENRYLHHGLLARKSHTPTVEGASARAKI